MSHERAFLDRYTIGYQQRGTPEPPPLPPPQPAASQFVMVTVRRSLGGYDQKPKLCQSRFPREDGAVVFGRDGMVRRILGSYDQKPKLCLSRFPREDGAVVLGRDGMVRRILGSYDQKPK